MASFNVAISAADTLRVLSNFFGGVTPILIFYKSCHDDYGVKLF